MINKDARSLPAVAQEDIRRKAVQAVLSGKKQKEVAQIFGVSPQAVCGWMKQYRLKGSRALQARKRGRPRSPRLLPWQAAQTVRTITDHHPEQLKLPFYLWTRKAVADLICQRFDTRLSVWTIGRYLKRWGLTPQKPVRRAYEQNPKEVRAWLDREYPAIRRKAKREGAEINWGDEMGLRSDHNAGRSYARCGCTPVIPGTGYRFRCNMISAITNRGELRFMVFKKRFNADVFIEFLERLIRQVGRKIYFIVDRHPVHLSGKVDKWLKKRSEKIEMFHLPSFSPELNPDEMLNHDVKANALGRRRPRKQEEMIKGVRGYLRSRQRRPEMVKKYFHEKHVQYAAH
jgi:transposase